MPLEASIKLNWLLLTGIGVISAAAFIIDIFIPLGVSGGVAYILFVMATYWIKGEKITIVAGVLATLLIIAGFVFSIATEYIFLSGINHFLTIVVVWSSVWFVNNYKTSINQLRKNYKMLFQIATDEILVYQLNEHNRPKHFSEINETACNMLGYSRDELLQKSLYDIVASDEEEVNRQINNVIENGEAVYEDHHMTKDGEIIPLELNVRYFVYNDHPTIISSGRDLRERRRLEMEILNISEQERQRIGQEMHDDLGQLLTVANLTARQLVKKMKDENMQGAEDVQDIADMVQKASESARAISHGLVPVHMNSENSLIKALQELTGITRKIHNIDIQYISRLEDLPISNFSAIHLYRIAQETITNAVKHANATCILVELFSDENHFIIRIKDNGIGFQDSLDSEGRGLRIMKFRADIIEGIIKINSKKGEGTELTCQIPKIVPELQ